MLVSQDNNDAIYQIQSVSSDQITVNNEIYKESLIISPDKLILHWPPKNTDMLTDEHLLMLLESNPDIILLGTGEKSIILSDKTLAVLLEKQFHVECMSTPAACRTYTILSAENRRVTAGLLL